MLGFNDINTITLLIPLVLTIIGYVGSYIVGNDCGSSNGYSGNVGNCNGLNNALSWMKYGIIIYVVMIPIIIMSAPALLLGLIFSKKPANTSNPLVKPANSNNKNNNLNRSKAS